jgi:tetratricopeptide (TPR) repeat protein
VSETLSHALWALELFRKASHTAGQANALNNASCGYQKLGDTARALECCIQALELHWRAGNRDGEGDTWLCLGLIRQQLGDQEQTAACARAAAAAFRDTGNRPLLARALTQLGDSLHAAGSEDGARAAWQEALAILDNMRDPEAADVRARLT